MKERNDINLNIKKTLEKNPNKKTLILKNNLEKINLEKKRKKQKPSIAEPLKLSQPT
jgi:hypothetical protein